MPSRRALPRGAPEACADAPHRRGSPRCRVASRSQAQVDMWIDYSSNEIDGPMSTWIYPLLGIWPFDKKARARRTPTAQPPRSHAPRTRPPRPRRKRTRPLRR